MSNLPSLIAHYLATTYPAVLPSFLAAANIPPPDLTHPPNPDLRTVIADHLSQSIAADTAQLSLDPHPPTALEAALDPSIHLRPGRTISGVSADSLLCVRVADLPTRRFDTASAS